MDVEQLRLSRELIACMRRAVGYAIEDGIEFVSPGHLLLALVDDEAVGPALAEALVRDDLAEMAARKRLPGVLEVPEGELPEGESPPFARFGSFAWKSPDGSATRYLDDDAYKVFVEGARRAGDGPYFTRHLALGYAVCSQKSGDLVALMGKKPQDVSAAINGLFAEAR